MGLGKGGVPGSSTTRFVLCLCAGLKNFYYTLSSIADNLDSTKFTNKLLWNALNAYEYNRERERIYWEYCAIEATLKAPYVSCLFLNFRLLFYLNAFACVTCANAQRGLKLALCPRRVRLLGCLRGAGCAHYFLSRHHGGGQLH